MINQESTLDPGSALCRDFFRDGSPIFVLCEGLEATLSDSKKNYSDKVNTLLSAWEHVTNFIPTASPEATQSLIEWAYKHTLTLVLRGEWPKLTPATRTHLRVTLQRCAQCLSQHPAGPKCSSLISLVNNPWANADLDLILNGQPDEKHEEAFCCSEKGELLTMRLKILCEERCEDIAVNLAAACVRTLQRSEELRSVSNSHDIQYMIDVYIVLLYKLKRQKAIFAQLSVMDLNEKLELVQRLSGQKPTKYGAARVWRNSTKAAELVAQCLVTAGMIKPIAETGVNTLEEIINSWVLLHSKLNDIAPSLPGMIRKLIEQAESAQHIYIFCAVLTKHFGDNVKPLVIELYIKALTTDMNELESQKAKSDKENVSETAKRLSLQFLKLSDVLVDNTGIARECVLTAFSLHPTQACFDRIKKFAIACGKLKENGDKPENKVEKPDENQKSESEQTIWSKGFEFPNTFSNNRSDPLLKRLLSSPTKKDGDKCNENQPKLMDELYFKDTTEEIKKQENVERSLDALILIKSDDVTSSANYDEKSVPNQVSGAEKLGLSSQLCDDLSVVLYSPRYHMLTWGLDWKELSSLCERYLENADEMRSTNKELKHLNIDYDRFKNWPSDDDTKEDFTGIEKGYEKWADDAPSDSSEPYGSFQPAGNYKRSTARRSLDDSSDSDSGSVMPARRPARMRKVHRLESSESDYDSAEPKNKRYRKRKTSVLSDDSDDMNTQDSQTDSLGSVVNDNMRHAMDDDSDVSNSDVITLFSADLDENKRETIKASAYTGAGPVLISEKRSDPAVLKELRMFRAKKPMQMIPLPSKQNENNNAEVPTTPNKFMSPMNLNPKIVLTRNNEIDKKIGHAKKQQHYATGNFSNDILSIQNRMSYQKQKGGAKGTKRNVKSGIRKNKFGFVSDSDILAKNVPGMNSLDMMVPLRMQSTVNVVQLSRNIAQSPNNANRTIVSAASNSGAVGTVSSQLPGTPSSGGHDSGVGMSPAGQTSSSLHDVNEEANQMAEASPTDSNNTSNLEADSPRTSRQGNRSQSPSDSANSANSSIPIVNDQILVCKPYGTTTYQVRPVVSGGRNVLTLQNIEEGGFQRQVTQQGQGNFVRLAQIKNMNQNTLPKFQQAFRKNIYTPTTDTTTIAVASTTDTVAQTKNSKSAQTTQASSSIVQAIPNIQVAGSRPILGIVQSSSGSVATPATSQTLSQLVQVQNSSQGVIYSAKLATNPSQLNIIQGNRTSVDKLNFVRRQSLSAVIAAPRLQQPAQAAQPAQTSQANVSPSTSLLNAPIEVPNPLSSTTLEQLREFESVLEQVKERSTIQPQTSTTTQTQPAQSPVPKQQQAALGAQPLIIPAQSSNAEFASNGNNVQFQQQEGSQIFQQKVSLAYVNQGDQKVTNSGPVVVVTSYCQPSASPALSVTSQSSSSPCVTPAPAPSAGKTTPSPSPKSAKKAAPKTVKTSTTNTSKVSPIAKPQQKPQEDEQTTQRIFAILTEYAEQLRNSPDLNNKPAPRRRSNPPTNPSQSSKRKKSGSGKTKPSGQQSSELSPSADDLGRTMGSEDSSSGVAQVQDSSPAAFSAPEEPSSGTNNDTPPESRTDSNDDSDSNAKRRNVIFPAEQTAVQPRAVIVQEAVQATSVSEALASVTGKMTVPTVLVSGTNYLVPMNLMKSGQQFTIVSGGSKLLTTGPVTVRSASSVPNTLVLQSLFNQGNKIISQPAQVKQLKVPLQNLPTTQSIVMPQANATQFSEDDKESKVETASEAPTSNAILVNKTQTINIIPRSVSEDTQQICGVITSNPNLTLPARFLNSSIAKLGGNAPIKSENVVCLTTSTATSTDKRVVEAKEKRLPTTIALAFTTQETVNNNQKDVKDGDGASDKVTKVAKRKIEEVANSAPLHSNAKIDTITALATKQPIKLETSSQFLPSSGLKSESIDSSCKVGNGVLCGNARLQEAWEDERKPSPETPWRYDAASTTSLNAEPFKGFLKQEPTDGTENQSTEMGGPHTYQAKKYFLNNSLEPFQQYSNKSHAGAKSQANTRLDKELLQQRMERKAAAMERELRLQKSLSEECEDLGVDEPSTSDLFPEADLLFDPNHSPSFDHSSQDATCSQSLGLKSYGSFNFRSQDSSSGSRDNSPNERRKSQLAQRTRTLKDTAKRAKKVDETSASPAKKMHLIYDQLSQDSSDASRLSPGNDAELKVKRSAGSSVKLELEVDSEGAVNVNNVPSSDESFTLLGGSSADVTIPSPLSPIAGPLLSTHKYTYSNKKRRVKKIPRSEYIAWDSPVSERTRSSSEDEDSSLGEGSQNEDASATNGLEDTKLKLPDHCGYLKKDKLQVNARVVLNRAEANAIFSKHVKGAGDYLENHAEEKISDVSDEEHHHHYAEPVGSRRASLRGQVKKGYACCNGSPERPKKKVPTPVKLDHSKLKKRLTGKPLGKKR